MRKLSQDRAIERHLHTIIEICDDVPDSSSDVTLENAAQKLDEFDEILGRVRELAANCFLVTDDRSHFHVAGTTVGLHIDECARCGQDIRSAIHARQ